MLRRLAAVGGAAALAGCAAGAGGAIGPPGDAAGTTTVAAAATLLGAGTTAGDPIEPLGEPGTQPREAGGFPHGGGPVAALTDVRAAGQATFDRVVLEFDERVPGYRVAYVEPPVTEDGSGAPVQVAGSAFLEIRATPASGVDLSGAQPRRTYSGPDRLDPPLAGVVTEVVRTGGFEAMAAWTVGLEERVPFGVAVLQDPPRLVVDVRHPGDGGGGTLGATCANPAGFRVGYPSDWSVNAGETVPACSRFAPADFALPEASDVRVAAVALSVEPVAFDRVTGERPGEVSRERLTVDGRDAVRTEQVTEGGLWPAGTPVTTYAIELSDGPDGAPRTLVADTVGLPCFDYGRNVEVLDAMVGTLDLDAGSAR